MGSDDRYAAPADADEFYRKDGPYVYALVRKLLGAEYQKDAEDAAADIMERLLVSRNASGENALGQYSPAFLSPRTKKPVTWRAFLAGKVALYVRGKREQVSRRNGRELLLCDTSVGDTDVRWVEMFGGQVWDDYPSLGDTEFIDRMRDYLATVPDEWEGPSLFSTFNELVDLLKSGERLTALQARLGASRASTNAAMDRIRSVLKDAMDAPPLPKFEVCGVLLSASEVREAADLLKAAKGNHVHRALAAHRLQLEGPRKWYLAFAAEERQLFPDVRTDPKTHRQPADHVKRAVIHRLERILTEAGMPPLEEDSGEEITRMDYLEAELWHIPGLEPGQVDAILSAVGKVFTLDRP